MTQRKEKAARIIYCVAVAIIVIVYGILFKYFGGIA